MDEFLRVLLLQAYKLSRVEICVANFTPPANDVSLGSYLIKNEFFSQKGWKQADQNSSGSQTYKPLLKWLSVIWVDDRQNKFRLHSYSNRIGLTIVT